MDLEKMFDDIFNSLDGAKIAQMEAYQQLKKLYGAKFTKYIAKRGLSLK